MPLRRQKPVVDSGQRVSARMRLTPGSRLAWRAWLEAHHTTRTEIGLVCYKQHTGKPTLTYDEAVEEALCFGWIDGVKRSIDAQRYMHRFSPRKPTSNWSATNKRRALRLIAEGLMTPAGMAQVEAAKRSGKWDEEQEPPRIPMPTELERRLRRDKKAAAFFDSLAPSYRRQYMAWVGTAKRRDSRNRRADEALELLRRGEKLGTV